MREQLAEVSGDVDRYVAVLAEHLTNAVQYQRIAEVLHTAGRRDEAIGWARRGVAANPGSPYNPATSRFNSVDSVYGGNANPYEYATGDSINKHDISGKYYCYRYRSSERKWYYWWGGWGGYRVDAYWQCYFSHNDTRNVTRLGLAYAIIAALTFWAAPVAAGFAAAAAAIGWIAWEYNDRCSRKRGAYINGTFRGYLTKRRSYSHGYGWLTNKFCA